MCKWSCVSGQRPCRILLPDGKRQRGRTVQSQGSGRQTRRGGGAGRNQKRGLYLLWDLLLPPVPPTRPSLGAHRPPAHGGHRKARAKGKRRGVWWFLQARPWAGPPTPQQRQNSRAFFLRSFLFQRARRSNSSMLIPNTSRNSSGDRCLCK